MYPHFDRKNKLFIMRYIPSHLHEILWSKMPSGGGFSSKPLSHLQCTNKYIFVRFNDSARSVKYYKSKTHNVLESWNAKFNNPNEELIEVPILDPPRSNSIEDDKSNKNKNNAPIKG